MTPLHEAACIEYCRLYHELGCPKEEDRPFRIVVVSARQYDANELYRWFRRNSLVSVYLDTPAERHYLRGILAQYLTFIVDGSVSAETIEIIESCLSTEHSKLIVTP